jgi:penicillin-insensitive murein endopeptidase
MRTRIAALSGLPFIAVGILAVAGQIAAAQAPTAAAPLPPAKPAMTEKAREKAVPAKLLFGAKALPSLGKSMAIGYYPRGCLSGGVELPINGPTWQVMRLSRNRNWGHPSLVHFIEKFAGQASKATGWNGILVGDMAQPRGGPTVSDHASHQTGLDVDIWFMPMPDRVLSKEERDTIPASNLVASDWKRLNPQTWTPEHVAFIKAAAQQPEVERVLVNAAIKKELCRVEAKQPHAWMSKVRPWYGHHDHIHVRLRCPADSPQCKAQEPVQGGDGCGPKELDFWFSDKVIPPRKPGPPGRQTMLADLPPACKGVLEAADKKTSIANDNRK